MQMLTINEVEKQQLLDLAAGGDTLARRAGIILKSGAGSPSAAKVAKELGTSPATVRYWRQRFAEARIEGLHDRPRPGAPRRISTHATDAIHVLEANGLGVRQIAKRTGVSHSSVARLIRITKGSIDHSAPTECNFVQEEGLVVRLFESLADANAWTRFLEALQTETHSDFCSLLVFSSDSHKPVAMLSGSGPLEGNVSYVERFYDMEPMAGIPEGKVTSLSDVLTADELKDSEFYKQYLSRYGVGYVLGVDIGAVRGITGRLRLVRLERRSDYSAHERLICERLVPFLRIALDLFVKRVDIETENEALSATISGMSVGSILVDADARIMNANTTARAILDQQDGLLDANGKLCLSEPGRSKELQDLIRSNAEASLNPTAPANTRSLLIDRPSGRESVSLLVRPATIAADCQLHVRQTALINLIDPAQPRLKLIDSLVQQFGLTRAEARVAISISNGHSTAETAQGQNISRNTIRSHLRSIYSKMGVSRQADLVRAVLSSVALLTAGDRA